MSPSCQLLGPTALAVQALMGIFVPLSLLYKRRRERPIRPWRIWLFDVSKQVVGQLFVHSLNVLISDVGSHRSSRNACVFYFLNILIDTTLGVALIYVILHTLTSLLSDTLHLQGFESGIYGDPPSFLYWMRQAVVYVSSLTTMKFLVLLILTWLPGLLTIGEWLLVWTHIGDGDSLEVIFVMGIFPIIMNILQFWFIDSIVKAHHKTDAATDPTAVHEPLIGVPPDDDDDDESAYVPHDIENPRPRSPLRSLSISKKLSSLDILSAEQKSFDARSSHSITDQHSYPPSLSSSLASISTRATSPKHVRKLKMANRRRNTTTLEIHAPSDFHSIHQPQPRIPQIASAARSLELEVRNPSVNDWTDSWDESGDWTDDGTTKTFESWNSTTTVHAMT
ncbi:hypothetical protein APHAL10511_001642 [Amanita phalloides]|nr:hypothetical protein APHAL10511_001642 [Amanita phalloides]